MSYLSSYYLPLEYARGNCSIRAHINNDAACVTSVTVEGRLKRLPMQPEPEEAGFRVGFGGVMLGQYALVIDNEKRP
jgi:hypothetical protein